MWVRLELLIGSSEPTVLAWGDRDGLRQLEHTLHHLAQSDTGMVDVKDRLKSSSSTLGSLILFTRRECLPPAMGTSALQLEVSSQSLDDASECVRQMLKNDTPGHCYLELKDTSLSFKLSFSEYDREFQP
jgi:hypothetical protein